MNKADELCEYYHRLFDSTFEGLFVYEKGVIIEANQAAARIFRYSVEEMNGLTVLDVVAPESREGIIKKMEVVSMDADMLLGPYETTAIRKDGSIFDAEVFSKGIRLPGKQARVVAFRDITEKKRAEQGLIENERLFRSLFETTFEGIFLIENWKIIDTNPAAAQTLGMEPDEILGRDPVEFLDDASRKKMSEIRKQIEKDPEIEIGPVEAVGITGKGERLDIVIHSRAIPYQGRSVRFISFRDITFRKNIECSLRESEQRLRKYNMALVSLANSEILGCGDLNQVASAITEAAAKTLDVAEAGIWMISDDGTKSICINSYICHTSEHCKGMEVDISGFPDFESFFKEARSYGVRDIHKDPRLKDFAERYLKEFNVTSGIDSPIRKAGEIIGALNVSHIGEPRSWSVDEQNFVASLAELFVTAQETCERQKAEEALERLLKLEDLFNQISMNIINSHPDEFGERLGESLERIGHFFKVDRAYIFRYDKEKKTYDNTHEWCEEGVESQKENLQGVPEPALPWMTKNLLEFDLLKISSLGEIPPDAADEKEFLEAQDVKSLLMVPMIHHKFLYGMWGMDAVKEEKSWPDDIDHILIALGSLFANVQEHKHIHDELNKAKDNLEQTVEARTRQLREKHAQLVMSEKMASLGQLVAGVAHEINTPLGALKSNNDVFIRTALKMRDELLGLDIDQEKINNSKLPKMFGSIEELNSVNKEAAGRITKIVQSLRNFARLDQAEKDTVDIHEGLESTLTLVHHEIKNRIDVHNDFGTIPKIDCFPNQINQVFMNILVNASQAIKDKGDIYIKTYTNERFIAVEIRDTGKGISKENIRKVFDPGFTTKGAGVGTGLGLSIVYQIIKDHNGEIEVESEVGKGTTFRILIPK